jgi:hypothetical protein
MQPSTTHDADWQTETRWAVPAPPLIYGLMPKIAHAIGSIGKDRKNQQQGFHFRGIDDVYNAAHGPLCEHGVFTTSEVLDGPHYTERQTAKGGVIFHVRLTQRTTFWASDGSSVSTVTVGEAMDTADKAANKAMSIATKYAYFQTFTIPVADDAALDPDHTKHEVVAAAKLPLSKPLGAALKASGGPPAPRRLADLAPPPSAVAEAIDAAFGPPANGHDPDAAFALLATIKDLLHRLVPATGKLGRDAKALLVEEACGAETWADVEKLPPDKLAAVAAYLQGKIAEAMDDDPFSAVPNSPEADK